MQDPKLLAPWLCILCLSAGGCDLFKTSDNEQVQGRGAVAFDPYTGASSGAVKLGLQQYNGCSIAVTGSPYGKGSANIPYPTECESSQLPQGSPPVPAGAPMNILSGTTYFLDKLAFVDRREGLHTDPKNMQAVITWMRTQSRFKSLDWSGVGLKSEEWSSYAQMDMTPASILKVSFGDAAWQLDREQTFTVEVLDAEGTSRSEPVVYSRKEFLAESERAGHIQLSWEAMGLEVPVSHNDRRAPTGGLYPPPTYTSGLRIEFVGLTSAVDESKRIRVPSGLRGDGALRVTWSAMPDEPFYFPVTFQEPSELASTCFAKDTNEPVACSFGLEPEVGFSPPQNGLGYYEPGETFEFQVSFRDEAGNYLHPANHLPSYGQYLSDQSNGLMYVDPNADRLMEEDSKMDFRITGPIQEMKAFYELADRAYFSYPELVTFPAVVAQTGFVPGANDHLPPTRYPVPLPANAKPGTYTVTIKAVRAWMGERFSKMRTFRFQVGSAQVTSYPNQVGNCQICHRGISSLDNIRHGESVDNVENCKACHDASLDHSMGESIHRVHMASTSYTFNKADCTVCHLTRESAVRPSFDGCVSCHQGLHGNNYFELQFADISAAPNAYSSCARACHVTTTPRDHILPQTGER